MFHSIVFYNFENKKRWKNEKSREKSYAGGSVFAVTANACKQRNKYTTRYLTSPIVLGKNEEGITFK